VEIIGHFLEETLLKLQSPVMPISCRRCPLYRHIVLSDENSYLSQIPILVEIYCLQAPFYNLAIFAFAHRAFILSVTVKILEIRSALYERRNSNRLFSLKVTRVLGTAGVIASSVNSMMFVKKSSLDPSIELCVNTHVDNF